jgi:hypothetical protein
MEVPSVGGSEVLAALVRLAPLVNEVGAEMTSDA